MLWWDDNVCSLDASILKVHCVCITRQLRECERPEEREREHWGQTNFQNIYAFRTIEWNYPKCWRRPFISTKRFITRHTLSFSRIQLLRELHTRPSKPEASCIIITTIVNSQWLVVTPSEKSNSKPRELKVELVSHSHSHSLILFLCVCFIAIETQYVVNIPYCSLAYSLLKIHLGQSLLRNCFTTYSVDCRNAWPVNNHTVWRYECTLFMNEYRWTAKIRHCFIPHLVGFWAKNVCKTHIMLAENWNWRGMRIATAIDEQKKIKNKIG